jgi:hypothetical protein
MRGMGQNGTDSRIYKKWDFFPIIKQYFTYFLAAAQGGCEAVVRLTH